MVNTILSLEFFDPYFAKFLLVIDSEKDVYNSIYIFSIYIFMYISLLQVEFAKNSCKEINCLFTIVLDKAEML